MCIHLINISASFPQKINVENAPSADSPQTPSIKDNFFSPAGENRILHLYWKPSRLFAIQRSFKHRTPLPGIWPGSENAAQCCLESGLDLGLTKRQEQLREGWPGARDAQCTIMSVVLPLSHHVNRESPRPLTIMLTDANTLLSLVPVTVSLHKMNTNIPTT